MDYFISLLASSYFIIIANGDVNQTWPSPSTPGELGVMTHFGRFILGGLIFYEAIRKTLFLA